MGYGKKESTFFRKLEENRRWFDHVKLDCFSFTGKWSSYCIRCQGAAPCINSVLHYFSNILTNYNPGFNARA